MSRFRLDFDTVNLSLKQPFTISRGTKSKVENIFVRLSAEGVTGIGEAGPNIRYGEDAAKVTAFLEAIPADFFDDVSNTDELNRLLDKLAQSTKFPSVQSAKAAVEMAWIDWYAKKQEQPLWKLWNAPTAQGPQTSYTIGLDDIDVMQQKVLDAKEFPIYKVKLGTGRDREIIRGIREVTDKPIRVDANEGWPSVEEAREMIQFLADQNIELVEQPMPASQFEDLVRLKQDAALPLCADESFMGDESLEKIVKGFDIINIKLMKIGSMAKARKVIDRAKELGLKVMIGCMIESSVANTAGAVLALWADYADLDGHLLITEDPYQGVNLDKEKHLTLPDRKGIGFIQRQH